MLDKKNRLTKRGSFTFLYNKGARFRRGSLTLVYIKAKGFRIGFSVPNKVGCAVVRNKLRRRLRAIVRGLLPELSNVQAVICAAPGAAEMDFSELETAVRSLFTGAKLLKEQNE